MSDLSRLLGDVYGSGEEDEAPPAPSAPQAPATLAEALPAVPSGLPEWADETVLDAAFASWVPGPPASAPDAERTMLTDLASAADEDLGLSTSNRRIGAGEWIFPADDEPVTMPSDSSPLEDLVAAAPMGMIAGTAWSRSDDDILAGRSRGRRHARR